MKQIVGVFCALILVGSIAAAPASAAVKKPAKAAPIYCPVTGELIASPKDAFDSEVYKGKTYYFCCAGCKPMFDADPGKYINKSKG
jgi:YHS domain-containing protein